MFEYEKVIQDLQDKGYTEQEIEEYIRREVNNDKNKKYDELNKSKQIFFTCLIAGVTVEVFKKKIEKTIKEPKRDYSKVEEMINSINPDNASKMYKKPNKKDIEKLMFEISSINEKKARDKYIRILTDYYSRTQKTINKEYIKETEYLLDKVSRYDKIEKVIPYYDKTGRIVAYHDVASYNSMIYNTNLTNAVWNETLRNAIDTENDLVYVPGHWGSCPHCFPYEDRVYSLTGVNPVYPSIQVALDGGLKHPNCKHPIENYNSRVQTTPSQSSPPEVYNALQKINALELKKRRLKVDKDIYQELEGYEEIDKTNQQIRKINQKIREQKSILEQYK